MSSVSAAACCRSRSSVPCWKRRAAVGVECPVRRIDSGIVEHLRKAPDGTSWSGAGRSPPSPTPARLHLAGGATGRCGPSRPGRILRTQTGHAATRQYHPGSLGMAGRHAPPHQGQVRGSWPRVVGRPPPCAACGSRPTPPSSGPLPGQHRGGPARPSSATTRVTRARPRWRSRRSCGPFDHLSDRSTTQLRWVLRRTCRTSGLLLRDPKATKSGLHRTRGGSQQG